jgi:hypothetical protein
MKEFEFTIKFSLGDADADPETYVDRLYGAGCDDALIGIGKTGMIALDFIREANNALEAVISAIEDVKRVIPDAQLVEATPDLVGLTDIADLVGLSRQYMRKLRVSNHTFPAPFHEGKTAIWHLEYVLNWFQSSNTVAVDSLKSLVEVANVNRQINTVKESRNVDPQVNTRISALAR